MHEPGDETPVNAHLARLLVAWEQASDFDDQERLWAAALVYRDHPEARDVLYRIIRDCLYTVDDRLRNLGAIGVDTTGWPEWMLVAADAARWVMQERLRLEGDHGAL